MSLFSFFRKNKQEAPSADGDFYSRAEDDATAARSRSKRKSKPGNEPVDPVLPEKKRARRRLIGAIALVLAAVIGLPVILDSEPKPLADNVTIQIPSKDTPGQQRRLQAPIPASAALDQAEEIIDPVASQAAIEKAEPAAVVASGNKTQVKPMPDASAAVEKPKPPVPATLDTGTKAEARPALKQATAEPKAAGNIEPKSEDEDQRARAILTGKFEGSNESGKVLVEKKPSKFMVQVAALASQEKINELRSKLKAAGISHHTQKVATATGERTRIRVGPFVTREEAEKMRAKLSKMGLTGSLVPLL